MICHYLPVEIHEAGDGITLTARTPGGRIFAAGAGSTFGEARGQLKRFVQETLSGLAEDGEDPLSLLVHGEVPAGEGAVVFDVVDLFPVALRGLRCRAGLTQAEVASRMGVTQSVYGKLERPGANPTLATIRRLHGAFGTPFLAFGPLPARLGTPV
jgi:DNA-binding XRE family transcriptional regulator